MTDHRKIFSAVLMLISATFTTTSTAAYAQADEAIKEEPTETRVIHLEHARASQLADVVSDLFMQCAIGVDHRTNSIITNCPAGHMNAIEQLIAQLDIKSGQENEQALLQVPSVSPGLRELLTAALTDGSRLAIDRDTGTVGIWGTADDVRRAHEVISILTAHRGSASEADNRSSYRVHFYYVTAQYSDKESKGDLPPLPKNLEPVGDALSENGFQQLGLLASMVVASYQDQHFQMAGSVDLNQMGDAAKIKVEFEGNLSEGDGDMVQLALRTQLVRQEDSPSQGAGRQSLFELNTTIQCGLDEYLVLSASPAGTKLFDAIALVIHVTR